MSKRKEKPQGRNGWSEVEEIPDFRKIQKEKRPPNNWKKLLERLEDEDGED
jgi:hypothetical protein